jgi:putative transposase
VKAGLESTKAALLVLIAALADGSKVVLAVESGHRESTESWADIRRDLTARGVRVPACAIGDGALGLWNAVGQVWPHVAEQQCWNHKLRNVVDAVPLKHQPEVQTGVQRIAAAESVASAEHERQRFHREYRLRFPKACERLVRDWARMLTYYQFPQGALAPAPHDHPSKQSDPPKVCVVTRLLHRPQGTNDRGGTISGPPSCSTDVVSFCPTQNLVSR